MKAVIKIDKSKEASAKLRTAARISGVRLLQEGSVDVGTQYMVAIDSLDPANFFEQGKQFATVKGNELDHLFATEESKAKEKAAKKAALANA
jgi:hypothetical protein